MTQQKPAHAGLLRPHAVLPALLALTLLVAVAAPATAAPDGHASRAAISDLLHAWAGSLLRFAAIGAVPDPDGDPQPIPPDGGHADPDGAPALLHLFAGTGPLVEPDGDPQPGTGATRDPNGGPDADPLPGTGASRDPNGGPGA